MSGAVELVPKPKLMVRLADQVSEQELRTAYWERNENFVTLGKQYDCVPGAIWRLFKVYGIPTRNQKQAAVARDSTIHPDEVATMCRLYSEGLSSNDIGLRLGRDGRLVRGHLERAGGLRSKRDGVRLAIDNGKIRKYHFREDFFDTLTPESAWVLGLIFGDGHVHVEIGEGYSIQLAGTKEVCEKVRVLLGHAKPPRKMKDANCWMVSFHSRKITESLAKYGLKGGSKARTMRFPKIPKELVPHFVRGAWDADGTWLTSAMYASASLGFIRDLRDVLEQHLGIGGDIREYDFELNEKWFKGWQLTYGRGDREKLQRWMYWKATPTIWCTRKFRHTVALCGLV